MQVKFLQSELWGELKSAFGWKVFPIQVQNSQIRIFVRSLPLGFSLVYIPYAFANINDLQVVKKELISTIKKVVRKPLFIRLDLADYFAFPSEEGIDFSKTFRMPTWIKKSSDVQPPDTVVLSLIETTEDELLAQMHKKTRYNIKLAEKKGVVVEKVSADRIKDWYHLYEVTSKRDHIAIHQLAYYQKLFELAETHPEFKVKLFLASHEGTLLAGIVVVQYENQAIYLYGASNNEKRNLMPAYALQWTAIKEALKEGCVSYDFYGIPPVNDPSHPMYGLYRFKTGFGGEIIHRAGAWDLPIRPILYHLFRFIEELRLFYYKRIKKHK